MIAIFESGELVTPLLCSQLGMMLPKTTFLLKRTYDNFDKGLLYDITLIIYFVNSNFEEFKDVCLDARTNEIPFIYIEHVSSITYKRSNFSNFASINYPSSIGLVVFDMYSLGAGSLIYSLVYNNKTIEVSNIPRHFTSINDEINAICFSIRSFNFLQPGVFGVYNSTLNTAREFIDEVERYKPIKASVILKNTTQLYKNIELTQLPIKYESIVEGVYNLLT